MPTECVVSASDRTVLEQWVRSPTVPQEWGLRAKTLLATADGEGVRAMARRLEGLRHLSQSPKRDHARACHQCTYHSNPWATLS